MGYSPSVLLKNGLILVKRSHLTRMLSFQANQGSPHKPQSCILEVMGWALLLRKESVVKGAFLCHTHCFQEKRG